MLCLLSVGHSHFSMFIYGELIELVLFAIDIYSLWEMTYLKAKFIFFCVSFVPLVLNF